MDLYNLTPLSQQIGVGPLLVTRTLGDSLVGVRPTEGWASFCDPLPVRLGHFLMGLCHMIEHPHAHAVQRDHFRWPMIDGYAEEVQTTRLVACALVQAPVGGDADEQSWVAALHAEAQMILRGEVVDYTVLPQLPNMGAPFTFEFGRNE